MDSNNSTVHGATAHGERHDHNFLGAGHDQNERKTWGVIALCGIMMVVEIVGGSLFGSLALVADGLHMSTHAGAMLIAALAYTYARRHALDNRFVFGTGKLGDLAGFISAVVLAMIALLIGYEAIARFLSPVPIRFREAIPIAVVGLMVNIVSAWLLSGHEHHGHGHSRPGDHGLHHHVHDAAEQQLLTSSGYAVVAIFEQDVPPRFRLSFSDPAATFDQGIPGLETVRDDGSRQLFRFAKHDDYWESLETIPEPHAFKILLRLADGEYSTMFEEHQRDEVHQDPSGAALRDNSIRSAYIHVTADAIVSVLAITGLVLARTFGWLWMDPLAGIVGALVIANWSYGLLRDTGRILLDMCPDAATREKLRQLIEQDGDEVRDLHLWRLGPGHLGAIISVATTKSRNAQFYRALFRPYKALSHVTVEVTSLTT